MPKFEKGFSFAELTSNSTGKTSASGTMGLLICVVGCFTFLIGVFAMIFFNSNVEILTQSILLIYAGAALLGYRKAVDVESEDKIEKKD